MDVQWKTMDHQYLLSLTLAWDCPAQELVERIAHYDVYHIKSGVAEFIGRAFVESYRVCQLVVQKNWSFVEFAIRSVTVSGIKRPLEECSHVRLTWM